MKVKCPKCKKLSSWEGNDYRPFCCERCKMADLGGWATGQYRVPTVEDEESRMDENLGEKKDGNPDIGDDSG